MPPISGHIASPFRSPRIAASLAANRIVPVQQQLDRPVDHYRQSRIDSSR
jgi:hypothetical protein